MVIMTYIFWLTDGKGKPPCYTLSPKVKIIQLDIDFELWNSSLEKVPVYLKNKEYTDASSLPPCLTSNRTSQFFVMTGNKLLSLPQRWKQKIGELHVNRKNYRNFEKNESNFIRNFCQIMDEKSGEAFKKAGQVRCTGVRKTEPTGPNCKNVKVISNPLPFQSGTFSDLNNKRITAAGRYTYQKGFDLLLEAWSKVCNRIRTGNYIYMAKETRLYISSTGRKMEIKEPFFLKMQPRICSVNTMKVYLCIKFQI